VRNAGQRAGRDVVQVYLEAPDDDPGRPLRVLAAFATVEADAGQTAEARMVIPARAFARFDTGAGGWVWPPGSYTVRVGRSSRDLRLAQPVQLGAG
jgi:beta-glucosidase